MTDLTPSDAPIDQPFWDGLAEGRLTISACAACVEWIWPPQWRCGACGSWEMAWREVERAGVVHSVTRTHHPFVPDMVGKTPFMTVLVELPQAGGARLLGQVEGGDQAIVVGTPVTAVIEGGEKPVLRWRCSDGGAA